MSTKRLIRSTTVLSIRRNGSVVLAGDGQVTLGESVIKHTAKKIRRLYNDKILLDLRVRPPTRSLCSAASNQNSSSTTATWGAAP